MPDDIQSVLFVCSQNSCRSIAAEAVFRYLAQNTGLKLEIDSAGTHATPGCLPDQQMCAAAALRGYDLSGLRSRPFSDDDCSQFDLILAADEDPLAFVRARLPVESGVRTGLLMSYASAFDEKELLLPQEGRGCDGVLDRVEDTCLGLIKRLL